MLRLRIAQEGAAYGRQLRMLAADLLRLHSLDSAFALELVGPRHSAAPSGDNHHGGVVQPAGAAVMGAVPTDKWSVLGHVPDFVSILGGYVRDNPGFNQVRALKRCRLHDKGSERS